MKTAKQLCKGITILLFLISATIYAQEPPQELYISVTTMHWNMDLDFEMQDWKDLEMEYHEKVTMKNEHILSTTVLLHHFTDDSSEILFVKVFPSWQAIEDAAKRDEELEKEAWPDKETREAFLKKQENFYAFEHSDEIYVSVPGAKTLEDNDFPLIYYVRTRYLAQTEEGTDEEFMKLHLEYNENVTHNNEYYKGYYPQSHHYGADRTEFVEVFLTETLADLEKGLAKQNELFRKHWGTEEEQNAFNDKFDKYFTGVHGDRIFSSVPELHKAMGMPEE